MNNRESIAIIADVHGNIWALDAVLEDMQRRNVTRIINLGDCAYGSLDPAGALDRLMAHGIPSVMGNQDRIIVDADDETRASADHQFALRHLNETHTQWIAQLPATLVVDDLFCCHGTPESDETYLLEEVTDHGVHLRDAAAVEADLRGVEQPVVVCAHSHIARTVQTPNGKLVVNPGSVGQPAYHDDLPFEHSMEAGSPHARYAILTRSAAGWAVEHVALPYDWDAAAETATRNGRADRGYWIRYGRTEQG